MYKITPEKCTARDCVEPPVFFLVQMDTAEEKDVSTIGIHAICSGHLIEWRVGIKFDSRCGYGIECALFKDPNVLKCLTRSEWEELNARSR